MALVRGLFFDTSAMLPALVLAKGRESPPRKIFRALIEGRIERPLTAWHCCLEFFAVATRLPEEVRISPAEAWLLLREEILARFQVCQMPAETLGSFFEGAVEDGIAGGRIYDLHIAEVARASGAEAVVTENRRHFTRLGRYGIRVLTAAELAAELPL